MWNQKTCGITTNQTTWTDTSLTSGSNELEQNFILKKEWPVLQSGRTLTLFNSEAMYSKPNSENIPT
jgi:hypothetical protein